MATFLEQLQPGVRVLDKRRGRERLVHDVQVLGRMVKLWLRDPQTGVVDAAVYPQAEVESRFEVVAGTGGGFGADSVLVRLVAECRRLEHAYLFNPLFATETSLIDPLPHQLLAVYGLPPSKEHPAGKRGLIDHARLRFLLADDAGAGKTIMAGLYIREMLLRRLVHRVLVVPPAGLVGNWERELRNLFRLRFRILDSTDASRENPFLDPGNDQAIVSLDTLRQDRMRRYLNEAPPYDLVVFDEAHKLSARRTPDLTPDRSRRYEMAEEIAAQGRHLLLLTATPHMGKDEPYYFLWRLLEPELLASMEAFNRLTRAQKGEHLLRRMKEQMVRFDGSPLYTKRESATVDYPLTQGDISEQSLYDQATGYCETHYNRAKQRNRGAAKLAMSVLQRRLASSTWALLKSLERREQKLAEDLRLMEAGLLTGGDLESRQTALPTVDVRDAKTADEEEAWDGEEESEHQDKEVAGATDARTVEELRKEVAEVRGLAEMARAVYAQKRESKFERLWEALRKYSEAKVLIFTEHRDTMEFLVERLEGLGFAGRVASIHGGLDYRQRDEQAESFRKPVAEGGARYLVATEAAGEGVNLQQSCWLLVNYDIPWNPARLEQRMGRVHRYKQRHDVLLLNLVAESTREGRVLKVLLDKMERIRKELENDKVFDVIGQQFHGISLSELIFKAVVEGAVTEVENTIETTLTKERVEAELEEQARRVEVSEVRALLEALKQQRESASLRRMMPAYVRRFFEQAAPLAGAGIVGDLRSLFRLEPCPDLVRRALDGYPAPLHDRLTFDRDLAMPEDALTPQAVYLHPGEAVFEAMVTLFLGQYGDEGERGGVFLDDAATEPYLFYLAKVPVLREPPADSALSDGSPRGEGVQVLEEAMLGVWRFADGRCEAAPAHLLLDLTPVDASDRGERPESLLSVADNVPAVETFVYETHGAPALERLRREGEARLPDRRRRVQAAYGLRQAELLEQRRRLKDAIARGEPAARSKLARCEAELDTLDRRRAAAESALVSEIDRMALGPVTFYVRALVLPLPEEQAERRRSDRIEAIAVREARAHEESLGSLVEDVSDPTLAMGFDLRSTRPDGSVRYIEVKGRARIGEIELTENEWSQAGNHRDRYWIYAVFNCDSATPALRRVPDPVGKGIGKPKGGVTIEAMEILSLSQSDDP